MGINFYFINFIFNDRMKKSILLILCVFLFSSCASIFCGSYKKVTLDSNVPVKANLTIDGRKYKNVSFPFVAKVKRGFSETSIKAEAEKYEPTYLLIDKTFNPVAILNLTSILGWGIDAATGAMMKPEFNYYELEFRPIQEDSKPVVKAN